MDGMWKQRGDMNKVTVALVVVLLAGCGGSATTDAEPEADTDDTRLARSMCADLEDGLSLAQMHSQAVEFYRETGRSEDASQLAAAELEDLATREFCPAFRDEFEATSVYEQWIEP